MTRLAAVLWVVCGYAQDTPTAPVTLARRYREGETLTYRMKGQNERWQYQIKAAGAVKKNQDGKFTEEYAWSDLMSQGKPFALTPASLEFRQVLSLAPDTPPAVPNLSTVQPVLIGPITDLLTFYADLWLAAKTGQLTHAGDHFYQKMGGPASWADGTYVVLGEDSIDFDMLLKEVDRTRQVATLLVRHVPPDQPAVHLPADWMREPVADTKNNWVEVQKRDGKYIAAAGKETFDVNINVSLTDGKILSATIENPVKARERECEDAGLNKCGEAHPHDILRRIEIALEQ